MIEAVLRADLPALVIPAADVAVQTRAQMGELLASALRDAPAALDRLIEIEEALPYPSVALAQAALAVTLRIRSELPPGTGKHTIAWWASTTGIMYAQAGRPADALPVTEEAVTIRRELAAANPDRYRPDPARSLNSLGRVLLALDRSTEAASARNEAQVISSSPR